MSTSTALCLDTSINDQDVVSEADLVSPSPFLPACTGLNPWYVLYVKPRHEKRVSTVLRGKDFEEFLPLYARRTATRLSELPLFPGYVFCRMDPSNRLPVLSIPGVFSVVGFAGKATAVDETEIEALQRVVRSGLVRQPWPTLPAGTRVTVARGPMQGVEGVVMRTKTSARIVISVTVLQRSVAVELNRDWLD